MKSMTLPSRQDATSAQGTTPRPTLRRQTLRLCNRLLQSLGRHFTHAPARPY